MRRLVELAAKFPKPTAEFLIFVDYADDVYDSVAETATVELREVMSIADKQTREHAADNLMNTIVERLAPQFEGRGKARSLAHIARHRSVVRQRILDRQGPHRRSRRHRHSHPIAVRSVRYAGARVGAQRGETQILGASGC